MADSLPLSRLALAIALVFASAAIGMAYAPFLMHVFGQGMFSHIAMTALGRWFGDRSGQAVSSINLGHPAGEILVPLLAVLLIGTIGW